MIKGYAFHSKFLYWENKENNINSFEVMTLSLFPNIIMKIHMIIQFHVFV